MLPARRWPQSAPVGRLRLGCTCATANVSGCADLGRQCSICTHSARAEIDEALAVGAASYRDVSRRWEISLAAVGRHAARHLPLHLARAEDAAEVAAADALLERLVDAEMRLTKLFHDAADAANVRHACAAVREIVRVSELMARIADAIPHPPTAPVQSLFVWPNGQTLPVVPLESASALAEAGGYVTPAPAAPAPVAGAGAPDPDHGKAAEPDPAPEPEPEYDYDATDPFPEDDL